MKIQFKVYDPLECILGQGWNPGIEHIEPENATRNYWYMWKLALFGEVEVDTIFAGWVVCYEGHCKGQTLDNHGASRFFVE